MDIEMKILLLLLLAVSFANCCELDRPVYRLDNYLSRSLNNFDLNLAYVSSTLLKQYGHYIQLESKYFDKSATTEVQECLCPYIQFAQKTLDFYFNETEKCLPHDICNKPECNVMECSEKHLDDAIDKFDDISASMYNCYNPKQDSCTSPHSHCEYTNY